MKSGIPAEHSGVLPGSGDIGPVARRVSAEARPIDDHRSTADYRRHAVGVLGQRLLERAITS